MENNIASHRPHQVRGLQTANTKDIKVTEKDYTNSEITITEKFVNLICRFVSIFSRKISVFTTNAENMNGNKYFRCNMNKNMRLYRGVNDKPAEPIEELSKETVQNRATNDFNNSSILTLEGNEKTQKQKLTIKVPEYRETPGGGNISYDDFIREYITTLDACIRLAKKENTIQENSIIEILFTNHNTDELNSILNKLNNDKFNTEDNVKNVNSIIETCISIRQRDVKPADSTSTLQIPSTGNTPIVPQSESASIQSTQQENMQGGMHNYDEADKSDNRLRPRGKKQSNSSTKVKEQSIQTIKNALEDYEQIEKMVKDIDGKLENLTEEQINNEEQSMKPKMQKHEISLGLLSMTAGDISQPEKIGLYNGYIVNAANAKAHGGAGVTGAIYGQAAEGGNWTDNKITNEVQQKLKLHDYLVRKDDNGFIIEENDERKLALGQIVVSGAYALKDKGVNGIIHAVSPKRDEEFDRKNNRNLYIACLVNSFKKSMLFAAKQDDADYLAMPLLGAGIYGMPRKDVLIAAKIASDLVKDTDKIKKLQICIVFRKSDLNDCLEDITKLRAIEKL